ncbi:MarR family winged helix-turn-helix transcriptional regulator [Pandoraea anhela]|uniref:HTH marR-type domain-containing protein n=1 Tax=Pandoraea anhela TaxID=2508295 RepID=A0A5E4XXQ0_9BURK|nr:MarR family winged helix-turn-helix transcriptional regulator [Pandoraea anhela]VVE40838.1 hypothetical protein PAN31108_04143 [Pandoraea anhela]
MNASPPAPLVCNNTALRKAARHVTRFYDACLAETGLRGTQYAILKLLVARGPSTIADLADALVMDRATMGHNLRPLERDGLIAIRVGQRDRREREVTLTNEGVALEAEGKLAWSRAQQQFEARFGKEDALAMRRIMARIAALDLQDTGAAERR